MRNVDLLWTFGCIATVWRWHRWQLGLEIPLDYEKLHVVGHIQNKLHEEWCIADVEE